MDTHFKKCIKGMLTQLQKFGNREEIISHIATLSINQPSLKTVTIQNGNYERLNPKVETEIHFLSETQAKLLHVAFAHHNESIAIMNKCSMLHPYTPVGEDRARYDAHVESSRIALRSMWKNIKDELTQKLPWIKQNFKKLTLCKGNIVAIAHTYIPRNVIENDALSLIPQKPSYLN